MIIGEGTVVPLLKDVESVTESESWKPKSKDKAFHVVISGTATVKVYVSNDGEDWLELFESTSTEGVENNSPWKYIKAAVDSYTSGSVSVYLAT